MAKVLYVRGFKDNLHDRLDREARKSGVSAASILEQAFEDWLDHKKEIPTKHHLVLYSEKESLMNFLKKMEELTQNDWTKICLGPDSYSKTYLKKHGWQDVTISPYVKGIKNTENYSAKVFDQAAKKVSNKTAIMGFMTGDIASRFSLKKANEIERLANSKRKGGIIFCPFNINDLTGTSIADLLELIEEHDKVYVLKKKEIFELNLSSTNPSALLL